mgnify:CR=1 FL=1
MQWTPPTVQCTSCRTALKFPTSAWGWTCVCTIVNDYYAPQCKVCRTSRPLNHSPRGSCRCGAVFALPPPPQIVQSVPTAVPAPVTNVVYGTTVTPSVVYVGGSVGGYGGSVLVGGVPTTRTYVTTTTARTHTAFV